jgi:adenosylhomocysteine nucleosidase
MTTCQIHPAPAPPAGRVSHQWRAAFALCALVQCSSTTAQALPAGELADTAPRVAVISAFAPEIKSLLERTQVERHIQINGIDFALGSLGGKKVVVFASGISMVNATMTAQLALDRFAVTQVVFSGIAGGVDPKLRIGDVAVPERWGQYLESVFARQVGGEYVLPPWAEKPFPNYTMAYPQPVQIRNGTHPEGLRTFWLGVDPLLLERARAIASQVSLKNCVNQGECLNHQPRILVGGSGVSGQAFVDNADFRQYVAKTFGAEVLDMETAAVASVAFANEVPFIAFRSVSDLAGGGAGENEMGTFMSLASVNATATLEAFLRASP